MPKNDSTKARAANRLKLARDLSRVLKNPETPEQIYNELSDTLTSLCMKSPKFRAFIESVEFIEDALTHDTEGGE